MDKKSVIEHNVPLVELCTVQEKPCLKFTFTGTLTETGAIEAIKKWEEIFNADPSKSYNLVWICHKMTGYEPKARIIWQNTMKRYKQQIMSIWLVTNSALIRAGGMIMSAFTSYDIKVVSTEEKIKL